jgi:hypothetical protein
MDLAWSIDYRCDDGHFGFISVVCGCASIFVPTRVTST